jgi:TetR/AcrR family transcriptional regulator
MEVAQQQGLLRDDLDPRQLSIMIMGIVFFWLDNRRHFAERFGGKPIKNADYLNTAVKMIEEGLLPRA